MIQSAGAQRTSQRKQTPPRRGVLGSFPPEIFKESLTTPLVARLTNISDNPHAPILLGKTQKKIIPVTAFEEKRNTAIQPAGSHEPAFTSGG